MTDRPFRILGVQQIAIGGQDKQRLRHLWVDLLGLTPRGSFRSELENVDEDILELTVSQHKGSTLLGWRYSAKAPPD